MSLTQVSGLRRRAKAETEAGTGHGGGGWRGSAAPWWCAGGRGPGLGGGTGFTDAGADRWWPAWPNMMPSLANRHRSADGFDSPTATVVIHGFNSGSGRPWPPLKGRTCQWRVSRFCVLGRGFRRRWWGDPSTASVAFFFDLAEEAATTTKTPSGCRPSGGPRRRHAHNEAKEKKLGTTR